MRPCLLLLVADRSHTRAMELVGNLSVASIDWPCCEKLEAAKREVRDLWRCPNSHRVFAFGGSRPDRILVEKTPTCFGQRLNPRGSLLLLRVADDTCRAFLP
ncbi:hypothetical protein O6H91_11G017000 [Diphasiastrum complanatum]|uniref:Uncharacterized protein n=1 Tax=Diphasiastrum complanatum TaxID=34168 RepID=A0ACC2C6L8_DIPCM|nr:hypothetical protein O6H91_11G017000 [Diphasiastrum complanatum]